jgi:hypothetical protein
MYPFIRKMTTIAFFACIVGSSMAQDPGLKPKSSQTKPESKPFKVLTNGRRITIQSNQDINRIMAWTTTGHRIVEQTSFDSPSYSFIIPDNEKFLFVMVQLKNGKYYTEKIGAR